MAGECLRVPLASLASGALDSACLFVVLLHGYSMQPEDLEPFAGSLGVPAMFYFPRAPGVAAEGGRCWWDRVPRSAAGYGAPRPWDLSDEHPVGRPAMRALLGDFLDGLAPLRRGRPLLLGGFSQGGMLACDYALHATPGSIDGLALLSSSPIALDEWQPLLPALEGLDCLVSHGHADAELSFAAGLRLRDMLQEGGATVDWVAFEGGHEIPLVVWRRLKRLMANVASKSPPGPV